MCRRMMVLPLVCKRWAGMLQQPSAAWEQCAIVTSRMLSWGSVKTSLVPLDEATVLAWFSRSISFMRLNFDRHIMICRFNNHQD